MIKESRKSFNYIIMVRINFCRITELRIISIRNISSVFQCNFFRIRPNRDDGFFTDDDNKGTVKFHVRNRENLRVQHYGSEKLTVGKKNSKYAFIPDKISGAQNGDEYRVRFYSSAEENNLLLKENHVGKGDWGPPEAKDLILIIEGDFYESIKSHESLLIYFYTIWCKHCKRFKSVYGAAAVKMKEENVPGRLGAVDVTKRMDVADMFNIVSVPALKYFRKGKFIKVYNGKRTTEDIINFMKNPSTDPVPISKIDI